MASKLPYVIQPGNMIKILEKIKEAQTPERFTNDFLATKLGFKGGNNRQFIPLAKKIGFLNSDGTPTELYKSFRYSNTSGGAVAQALRKGYKDIFERNEYANDLDREKFKGLVVEITGLEANNRIVNLICQTFEALKKIANFKGGRGEPIDKIKDKERKELGEGWEPREFDLGLSYIINLVLPKTDDPAVFNAIFRALRDNLLRK